MFKGSYLFQTIILVSFQGVNFFWCHTLDLILKSWGPYNHIAWSSSPKLDIPSMKRDPWRKFSPRRGGAFDVCKISPRAMMIYTCLRCLPFPLSKKNILYVVGLCASWFLVHLQTSCFMNGRRGACIPFVAVVKKMSKSTVNNVSHRICGCPWNLLSS